MTADQLLVLIALLDPWKKGGPWPGVTKLMKGTGLGRAEVLAAVEGLEAGWIRREIDRTEIEQPDRQRAEDLQRDMLAAMAPREPRPAPQWKGARKSGTR